MVDFGILKSIQIVYSYSRSTPYGFHRYNRLPFGFNSPQDVSQRAVDETFGDAIKNAYSLRLKSKIEKTESTREGLNAHHFGE